MYYVHSWSDEMTKFFCTSLFNVDLKSKSGDDVGRILTDLNPSVYENENFHMRRARMGSFLKILVH